MYNVTEKQKELLRTIVAHVRDGTFGEDFHLEYTHEGPQVAIEDGAWVLLPGAWRGRMEALARSGHIIVRGGGESVGVTLTGNAYEAVDSDFKSLQRASASPSNATSHPLEITESLDRFRREFPDERMCAFLMMQFGATPLHEQIVVAIRETLSKYGIACLRADDREFHEDLFPNVLTYMHGCGFGIAVFERLESDIFNPNVSLEVGYMRAIRRQVCLLKDKTLKTLPTDLVGKLYRQFDPQDPQASIPGELEKWLRDKDIITM